MRVKQWNFSCFWIFCHTWNHLYTFFSSCFILQAHVRKKSLMVLCLKRNPGEICDKEISLPFILRECDFGNYICIIFYYSVYLSVKCLRVTSVCIYINRETNTKPHFSIWPWFTISCKKKKSFSPELQLTNSSHHNLSLMCISLVLTRWDHS